MGLKIKIRLSAARIVAFDTLLKVAGGGYASDLLAASALSSRDAALASEIVFGVLRFQGQLDFLIEHYSGRPAARLDLAVRLALRMGIYQLRYLDRIPAHAAVSESVELIRRARKSSAAGLANAVLRKVSRDAVAWPNREIALSHPEWLLARWEREFGPGIMEGIARANLKPPETYIRVPPGGTPPEGYLPTELPGCYVRQRSAGFEGSVSGFRVQDIGSQSIVPLLELSPGQSFLDLCAAPGNKTAQALESGVRAVACDLHPRRLAMLSELGIPLVTTDATQPLPFRKRFDRILLDAPCSGTGTLARNPEIKWRLSVSDVKDLHRRQVLLLKQALAALAAGGRLVYSTCSLEREENDDVLAAAGVEPARVLRRIPGRDAGDGFFAAVVETR